MGIVKVEVPFVKIIYLSFEPVIWPVIPLDGVSVVKELFWIINLVSAVISSYKCNLLVGLFVPTPNLLLVVSQVKLDDCIRAPVALPTNNWLATKVPVPVPPWATAKVPFDIFVAFNEDKLAPEPLNNVAVIVPFTSSIVLGVLPIPTLPSLLIVTLSIAFVINITLPVEPLAANLILCVVGDIAAIVSYPIPIPCVKLVFLNCAIYVFADNTSKWVAGDTLFIPI